MRTRLTQKAVLLTVVLGSVIGLLGVSAYAKTDAPPLGPEMKKLEGLVGDWRYEGEQVDPPVAGLPYGGAGKYFGTCTYRFVLNGFFLEAQVEDNNPEGKTSLIRMTGYDPIAKKYVEDGYDSEASRSVGTATLEGQTWTVNSSMLIPGGKKVLTKVVVVQRGGHQS